MESTICIFGKWLLNEERHIIVQDPFAFVGFHIVFARPVEQVQQKPEHA